MFSFFIIIKTQGVSRQNDINLFTSQNASIQVNKEREQNTAPIFYAYCLVINPFIISGLLEKIIWKHFLQIIYLFTGRLAVDLWVHIAIIFILEESYIL